MDTLIMFVFIGLGIVGILAILVLMNQSSAKKKAKRIIATGRIGNQKEFDRISSVLATIDKDLEAADLWHKLQEVKDKEIMNTNTLTEKKKPDRINRSIIILGVVLSIVALGLIIGSWLMFSDSSSTQVSTYTARYPTITYKITGSAYAVDITLNNATGGTEQYSNIALPAEFKYPSFKDDFLYVSAQNQGSSGWVRVSIYVNGDLYKTSTSQGGYVIASASGSCP